MLLVLGNLLWWKCKGLLSLLTTIQEVNWIRTSFELYVAINFQIQMLDSSVKCFLCCMKLANRLQSFTTSHMDVAISVWDWVDWILLRKLVLLEHLVINVVLKISLDSHFSFSLEKCVGL